MAGFVPCNLSPLAYFVRLPVCPSEILPFTQYTAICCGAARKSYPLELLVHVRKWLITSISNLERTLHCITEDTSLFWGCFHKPNKNMFHLLVVAVTMMIRVFSTYLKRGGGSHLLLIVASELSVGWIVIFLFENCCF